MARHKAIPISWDLGNLQAEPAWRGAIDVISPERIFGWVLSTKQPMRPVEIEIVLLGEVLLCTVARIFRGDIASHLHLPVKSGFDVAPGAALPAAAAAALKRLRADGRATAPVGEVIELRVRGTAATLPFSSGVAAQPLDLLALAARLAPRAEQLAGGLEAEREKLLARPLPQASGAEDPRVIAYYLPQFHPFPENDRWWGTGFSEWTNVTAARPWFDGHHQPQLPADLGFYDLRLDQVQADQIALAQRYGLSGFCYYYYWFAGKTLMTLPIDRHLEQGYDFDFCLCWANESWSRRWDGSEEDVLIAQGHGFDSDVDFIRSCLKYFRSERYIKIDGAPLLQVYRIGLLESPVETIARWREIVREAGFPDLHVSMVESFQSGEPHSLGCDSSCQFPPLQQKPARIEAEVPGLDPGFTGAIFSYADILRNELTRPPASWLRFRTAVPSWDNTARRGAAAHVYHGATPAHFGIWLRHLLDEAQSHLPAGRRLVFINAWNEWAEGAHLEPDRRHGHAWLQAVRDALAPAERALAPLRAALGAAGSGADSGDGSAEHPLVQTARQVAALQASNRALSSLIRSPQTDLQRGEAMPFVAAPPHLLELEETDQAVFGLDLLNGQRCDPAFLQPVAGWQGLHLKGWVLIGGQSLLQPMIALRARPGGQRHVAMIHHSHPRPDVAEVEATGPDGRDCGFTFDGDLRGLPGGVYAVELISPQPGRPRRALVVQTGLDLLIG